MNARIKEQLIKIRDSGLVNMLDTKSVQYLAHEEGYLELVLFIEEHKKQYLDFIMTGEENELHYSKTT